MALTDAELVRLEAMESIINDLQTAISNLASKRQLSQLLLIKQEEIDALTTRVASLEAQLVVLQGTLG